MRSFEEDGRSGGQRGEALERVGDRGGPGPVGGQVQRELAGVAGELAGDVQQPVAQALGLADAVLAVEEQLLGPDGQIVGAERGFQPRLVGRERREGQVGQAGALELADAVFDDRVRAVASLQGGQVVALLVGDEALKAVPVDVGEAQLRARMRALSSDGGCPTFCV